MSHIPKPNAINRDSSFARAFYQTTESPEVTEALSAPARSPMPPARRKGYHNREPSRRTLTSPNDTRKFERNDDENQENHDLNPTKSSFVDNNRSDRHNIPVEENVFGTFDDKEVLEQYRMMAQLEARTRVKENLGFDILEYEKRRKLTSSEQADHQTFGGFGARPKIRLPPPNPVHTSTVPNLKPEEPPFPPVSTSWNASKFLNHRIPQPRDPDLGMGTSVRGGATIPHDEHVVRCLGCRGQLRVKLTATLVQCPECSTVSPASSTRR
jgi:hypothetical protein